MIIERRASQGSLSSTAGKLVGYASVYGPLSEDLGGFRERIAAGAFQRTLESRADVRALVNHDSTLVLGRRSAGTLSLTSDSTGLRVEIDPPATTYANDLKELIARGDVSQMSFGFFVNRDEWILEDEQRVRIVHDLDLIEVSVVTIPAYPDTTIALRSRDRWEQELVLQRHLRERRIRVMTLGRRRTR